MSRREANVDQEELERLSSLIEAQQESLGLEANDKKSRRGMLKLAGAAIVGAAGGVALSAIPTEAAQGGNMLIGMINEGTNETGVDINGTAGPFTVFGVTNSDTSGAIMDGIETAGKNGGNGLSASSDSGAGVLAFSLRAPTSWPVLVPPSSRSVPAESPCSGGPTPALPRPISTRAPAASRSFAARMRPSGPRGRPEAALRAGGA